MAPVTQPMPPIGQPDPAALRVGCLIERNNETGQAVNVILQIGCGPVSVDVRVPPQAAEQFGEMVSRALSGAAVEALGASTGLLVAKSGLVVPQVRVNGTGQPT